LADPNNQIISSNITLFGSNKVLFQDGTLVKGTCINCPTHPCMYFRRSEINPSIIKGLPHNISNLVCPVDAISIHSVNGYPIVDGNACIGCGLCVSRCPIGAININPKNFVAEINIEDNQAFVTSNSKDKINRESTYRMIVDSEVKYTVSKSPISLIEVFMRRIMSIYDQDNHFENILNRNLLIGLEIPTITRVIGDTNFRIDMLSILDSKILVIEVDVSPVSLLETPRALLDNIAVLNARYNIDIHRLIPLVICAIFPNKRTDYYEVLADIRKVLEIDIKTISIAALLLCIIYKVKLDDESLTRLFSLDNNNTEIYNDILTLIPTFPNVDYFYNSEYFGATK